MSGKPVKILLSDAKPYDREFFKAANRTFGYDLHFVDARMNEDTAELAQGFDVICPFVNDRLTEPVADRFFKAGIRLVTLRCAGYNNVALKAFFGRIHVTRVPAYSPHAVAEHTIALLLSLNRKTYRAYARTRDNNFAIQGLLGFDLHGKTAGIIGTGKIGKITAEILHAFGMRVLAYDLFPDSEWSEKTGCTYVDLPELYQNTDVISLHCPLTPDTHHMICTDSLRQMRPGVFLLNTGRGGLIDTPALIEGLKNRRIGGAGLDVYEEEDRYFFEDWSTDILDDDVLARLLSFPNVLITSHQAFFTREAMTNIAETTLNNVRMFFENGELPHEICYRCGETPCRRKERGHCFRTEDAISASERGS